jgi:hypothetical protein
MQEIQDYYVKNDIVPKVPENWNRILWEWKIRLEVEEHIFINHLFIIIK